MGSWAGLDANYPLQHRTGVVGTICQIRWRPAGPQLLTNDDQPVVRVWDWATEANRQFEHVAHATLSPDGATLLAAHTDGAARLWDAATGELVHALADHGDAIGALAWRPDGQQVLTGGADGVVRLWDVATGRNIHVLAGHTAAITQSAWSPDGRAILTSDSRLTQCWDATSAMSLATVLHPHESVSTYGALAWSPDSRHVLSSSGFSWTCWDGRTGAFQHTVEWHAYSTSVWSPNGRQIATYGDNMNCGIWHVMERRPQRRLDPQPPSRMIAGSADGTLWLTEAAAGVAQIWEIASNRVVQQLSYPGWIDRAAWSPDGRYLLTIHVEHPAVVPCLWEVQTGALVAELGAQPPTWVYHYHMAWHPEGSRVALQGADQPIVIYDGRTGHVMTHLADDTWHEPVDWGDSQAHPALAWSPDGRRLLAASGAGTRIWDGQTGRVLLASDALWRDSQTFLIAVGWGAVGPQLLTTSWDGRARLWDATSGELVHELEGAVKWLYTAAWSPDGRSILAGDDRAAWIWDSMTGQAIQLLEGHTGMVRGVAWIGDGQQAVTSDGVVRMWIVASEALEAELIRRVGEVHVESHLDDEREINRNIRHAVRSWRGWRTEQAAVAAALRKYDQLCATPAPIDHIRFCGATNTPHKLVALGSPSATNAGWAAIAPSDKPR